MIDWQQTTRILPAILLLCAGPAALGLDGSRDVFVSVPTGLSNGWKTFEIISGEDDLSSVAVGDGLPPEWDIKWDGLGAYRHDAQTLRIFVNHEAGPGSSFTRIDLDPANLLAWIGSGIANNTNSNQVIPAGPVVKLVSRGWLGVGSGTDPLNNPCSGNIWHADTFGPGLGFSDALYMFGEEVFGDYGHIWVMDLASRLIYEATDLGSGSWENATIIDTGRTDTTAILLSDDRGVSSTGLIPFVLYVGQKDPDSTDFLARNGLSGGQLYYWHADSGGTNGTTTGLFSGGNGSIVHGSWKSSPNGAVLFSKSEDLHVNVDRDSTGYGRQVALASQNVAVFLVDCTGLGFVAGDLSADSRGTSLQVLYQAGTQESSNDFSGMDNLVWSPDGRLYVNEDDGEGDIWVIEIASLLDDYAAGDTSPGADQVYQILDADYAGESSGIIDISESLDYVPGSIFLTTGLSTTLANNQIALCVSPQAKLKSEVYTDWVLGFPSLDTVAKRLATADPDADGCDNASEFALGRRPDLAESTPPLILSLLTNSTQASFTAARSLDLVDYYVDYTSNLLQGFNQTVRVEAADIDGGTVTLGNLPRTDQLFVRIRAVLP